MTDGNQNVVASYKYDAWGNDLTDPQSQVPNPFKYVGGLGYYSDKDSGLKLLGVRYYDSQIGRFWSLDPFAVSSFRSYQYADNNPMNLVDPKGLQSFLYTPPTTQCLPIGIEVNMHVLWSSTFHTSAGSDITITSRIAIVNAICWDPLTSVQWKVLLIALPHIVINMTLRGRDLWIFISILFSVPPIVSGAIGSRLGGWIGALIGGRSILQSLLVNRMPESIKDCLSLAKRLYLTASQDFPYSPPKRMPISVRV